MAYRPGAAEMLELVPPVYPDCDTNINISNIKYWCNQAQRLCAPCL